jgi:hypothetical protein
VFEQCEGLVGGAVRLGVPQDEAAGLKGEMSQGGAADVALGGADGLGDGPRQGRFMARPHAVGVVAQRGGLLHHACEIGEPRVCGMDGRMCSRRACGIDVPGVRSRTAATSAASRSSSWSKTRASLLGKCLNKVVTETSAASAMSLTPTWS